MEDPRVKWHQVKRPDGGIPAEDIDPDALTGAGTSLVPLSLTADTGPDLLWDDDDNLVTIEETM